MSLLSEYMKKEQLLKQLSEELQQLEKDQRLTSELEFKEKLEALMKEYDKSPAAVIEMLDPQPESRSKPATQTNTAGRRKRKLKIYKNPNTGEVVETRGGNQKTLKAWKDEYGNDTVESWLVRVEE
ncbi:MULTISPECIES: histone-like nucleoid-structuring protein, MvaT/MvaU family [Chromohalobacter]|mgnify:CR=1 FL=1|uniref:histone-like nucleoid-structuring protein, MvaT/MvaU family n=1 Tax=Chromohalobacter TaxID=42054 RepID=UPI000554B491|nr:MULTISPECIES: histone-like nucleoid-structuring protein, MvaT/MvaU family [Chromohalobacter]MBZ5876681.1 DNA binding protein [Chromohalobacter salexigens]MDF9435586.1 DNA binding protein [Chromohalobacter israelensis]NWO57729.1 H-NS histone [Chromohalobacter salexigens]PWW38216.1 H-NS histone family protein [Chromohalobacter salexigens]